MVCFFIAVKNRYLNLSAELKFTTNFSLACQQSGRFLLTEEPLLTWTFRRRVSLFKYEQESRLRIDKGK